MENNTFGPNGALTLSNALSRSRMLRILSVARNHIDNSDNSACRGHIARFFFTAVKRLEGALPSKPRGYPRPCRTCQVQVLSAEVVASRFTLGAVGAQKESQGSGRRQLSREGDIPHSATCSRSERPLRPRTFPIVHRQSTQACFPRYFGSAHKEIRTHD